MLNIQAISAYLQKVFTRLQANAPIRSVRMGARRMVSPDAFPEKRPAGSSGFD
jgi:hypothetical protein